MTKQAGIIGLGGMGLRHLAAYQKSHVDVVAGCDQDAGKWARAREAFPEMRLYSDLAAMLVAERNLDVISVVTNGPTHSVCTMAAAESGVPAILAEKPLATNLDDARRAIEACDRAKCRLAVNHIRRYHEGHRTLRRLFAGGLIGELRHMTVNCGSTGLGNMGVHFLDAMRFYSESEIDWVSGVVDKTGTPNPRGAQYSDPGGYAVLCFHSGMRGFLDLSEDTGVPQCLHLVGVFGRVEIEELAGSWRIRVRRDEDRSIPLTRYGLPQLDIPFEGETRFDIVEMTAGAIAELLSGAAVSSTGSDGYRSLEGVIAIHASDRLGGGRVKLPLVGQDLSLNIAIA